MSVLQTVGLGMGAVLALLGFTWRGDARGAAVAKVLASFAFVTAAMGAPTHASYYGVRVVWATSLGMVGDVLLLRQDRLFFILGLLAFLLGHGAYIDAFLHQGFDARVLGLVLLLMMLPAARIQTWLGPRIPAGLTYPVQAYLLAISFLVASAIASIRFSVAPTLQVGGACLFYASDLCVARQAFVQPERRNALVGLPLYYAAQWLLVSSLGIF